MTLPQESAPSQGCCNIYEFVANTDFPEDFKESFKKAVIGKVEISTREKIWRIYLEAQELLSKQLLQSLAERLGTEIPGLRELFFEVRYRTGEWELPSILTNYRDDVVFAVSRQHPIIYNWLNSADWRIDGNRLTITVKNELGLEVLCQKKADSLISTLLCKEFGVNVETLIRAADTPECDETGEWLEQQEEELARALVCSAGSGGPAAAKKVAPQPGGIMLGKPIKDEPRMVQDVQEEEKSVVIQGRVFNVDVRELKSGRTMITFDLTDLTDSITVKVFDDNKGDGAPAQRIKNGLWLKVRGPVQPDKYSQELTLIARDIQTAEYVSRTDNAPEKRVELHLHTKMSSMDGINGVAETIARAAAWGHPAVAVTDHGVVQAFPDAYEAGQKHGIRIIYGVEGYLIDDGEPIVINPRETAVAEETFVVFDLETTGFSPQKDEIIEIGAVKIAGGEVAGRFSRFVRPTCEIPMEVRKLTGITMEMVAEAPGIMEVLPDFMKFVGDAALVAHNAQFDTGFLRVNLERSMGAALTNPVLDTLGLARALFPKLKNHKLKTLAEEFKVGLANHHRAVDDAEATVQIFQRMLPEVAKHDIKNLDEINGLVRHIDLDRLRSRHIVILVKNEVGLKNLYRLITASHLNYFHRHPRIPKSELMKNREGLILGSACESGELMRAVLDGAGPDK
ncbi:MAG: exonuclease domain-containing protein, partial [Bacillota bacterium]